MANKTQDELNPAATFEMAQSYRIAADRLLTVMYADKVPVRDPAYFLYAHAAELALKSLLLSHGLSIPTSGAKGHELVEIYESCLNAKLLAPNVPSREIGLLIGLFNAGNYRQRYRYAGKIVRFRPTLDWVCEAVGELMQTIEPHVATWVRHNSPAPPSIARSFGKPIISKKPKPIKPGP